MPARGPRVGRSHLSNSPGRAKQSLSLPPEDDGEEDGLCVDKDRFVQRLEMEWSMRTMMPQSIFFLFIFWVFLANIILEKNVSDVAEVNENYRYHYNLREVPEINTFKGIYEFLYAFFEAAERFDPLDRERYVKRRYLDKNGTIQAIFHERLDGVELTRKKRFYVTNALVIRPQIWMRRAARVPCKYFAEEYDKLYSMTRYMRYVFRGRVMEGGWQPEVIKYEDKVISKRTGGNPPPPQSEFQEGDEAKESEHKSELLMCLDRSSENSTLRTKLVDAYRNIKIERGGEYWFGDFYPEKLDILAYMGYQVYANQIEEKTHPRCFTENKRNENGEVEFKVVTGTCQQDEDDQDDVDDNCKYEAGTMLRNGSKVSFEDVDDRCDYEPDTWHDVQTNDIKSDLVMYTPGAEIFTRIQVRWKIEATGKISGRYRLDTFQSLKDTPRHRPWLAFTILQIVCGLIQFILIIRRVYLEIKWAARCPKGSSFEAGEKVNVAFALALQATFMFFYLHQLVRVETEDILARIELFLKTNPYASEEAEEVAADLQAEIFDEAKATKDTAMWAFILVLASFVQLLTYLQVHPQIGLVAATIKRIAGDLFGLGVSTGVILLVWAAIGFYTFGDTVEVLSSIWLALQTTISYGLGNFRGADFGSMLGEFPDKRQILMLVTWESIALFVVFLMILNFLLSVVVDGLAPLKGAVATGPYQGIVSDFIIFFRLLPRYVGRGWPSRPQIIQHVQDLPVEVQNIRAKHLAEVFNTGEKDGHEEATRYLELYTRLVKKLYQEKTVWMGSKYLDSIKEVWLSTTSQEENSVSNSQDESAEFSRMLEDHRGELQSISKTLEAQGDEIRNIFKDLEEISAHQQEMRNQIQQLEQQKPLNSVEDGPKGKSLESITALFNEQLDKQRMDWQHTLERDRAQTLGEIIANGTQQGWIPSHTMNTEPKFLAQV